MKNKKGKVAVEILIMLVTIVLTSAIIFLLIQADVIEVKDANSEVSVLNTEFIPMGREGYLAVKEFKFCDFVDPGYNCISEGSNFNSGSEVHFLFVVESSTYNGEIMLAENYKIKGPNGNLLLDIDEKNNFNFEINSKETKESITFKDFFFVGSELIDGQYTLELVIENPLLNKKTTLVKNFQIGYVGEIFGDVEEYGETYEGEIDYSG